MTEKETAEIRRRMRAEKNSISHIRGCYVSTNGEIISTMAQPLNLLSTDEADRFLALLRRVLSGKLGRNLLDLNFTTAQVMSGEEHRLLTALRDTALGEEEVLNQLYTKIIENLKIEGQYLILVAYDTYDVPRRSKFGDELQDDSDEMFRYILCAICPVKATKPALGYDFEENEFRTLGENRVVSSPKLGFMFPTFDDRTTNIYSALYYTQDVSDSHSELADALFGIQTPMPADTQRQTFSDMLTTTLEDECSFEVVQTVHEELCKYIDAHREAKIDEPLQVPKTAVKTMLESCGVSGEHLTAFDERYEEAFGDEDIMPANVIDAKTFEVRTPDVIIKVSPERTDLIETRIINGMKYILISADTDVEVNGVPVRIDG